MKWIGLYTQKIVSLHALAQQAETTVGRLCASYSDETVGNGLSKSNLFKNATTGSYTMNQALYLNQECNLPHNKDKRTPLQYATDLIIGWLCEDAIVKMISQAELIGADKTRDFLTKETITHHADISTPTSKIEVVFDYTNHWITSNKLDLRDNKKEYLEQNNITLLGVAPRSNKALVLADYQNFTYGEIPAYGKMGWSLQNVKGRLVPLNEALQCL